MKKSVSLKLIVFSFLLVGASVAYSAPDIGSGTGDGSIVAGVDNEASGKNSSTFGYLNNAGGKNSSAFGYNNSAVEDENSAFGYRNNAGGKNSSAFGYRNITFGEESSAFGHLNTTNGKNSSAFGYWNTAKGEISSAFGYQNFAEGENSSAFGYANKANEKLSSAFGTFNEAKGERSSAFGTFNEASGEFSSALGYGNKAIGKLSSAFGTFNKAIGENGSAFGFRNEAIGKLSSAFGYWNTAKGENSSAFGNQYKVTGEASGAFGVGKRTGWNSTTHEYNYDYINEGKHSYMFGNYNKIATGTENNFILGNNVSIGSGINNSVALGNNSTVSSSNEVSVGSGTLKRKIVNVGDGEISNSSTDAVTGKQLYSGEGIDTAAWKAKLGVGSGGVDLSAYAKRDASNLIPTDISAWQTSLDVTKKADYKDANDIDVNKWKAKLGVGSGGGGGAIDAYTKAEADNKFANKTDLNDYTKKDDYKDANGIDVDKWKAKLGTGASSTDIQNLRNEVYEKIDNVKDEVRDVGSLSAALAGLHPMQYDPKAPAQVMAALGHYKDRQAVAVGASYYFNDRFMMSTGVALSGEKKTKTMANVGFTLKLGKGSGVAYNETPQYVVQNEVKRLTVENQDLKSKINNQDNRIKEQDEKIKNLEEKLNRLLKIK